MKYYYIRQPWTHSLGTSKLAISRSNTGLTLEKDKFWDFSAIVRLDVYAAEQEDKLYFKKYVQTDTYTVLLIPELKAVLERFNMPEHRWYQAQAGYNLEFVSRMKKYFNIDYDIDLNEKREYWILQLLDRKRSELAFDLIEFQLNDYDTFTFKDGNYLNKGTINTYQEYKQVRKAQIQANNRYPEPSVYIYRKDYDILWAGTHIVFNEKVKSALDATGIITLENGLEFAEFTDYQIQMIGEQA